MEKALSIIWELFKIGIIPLAIWYFEKQIKSRDDRRESEYAERKRELDEQQRENQELQFLMMQRMDKLSDMTHLMAKKLHEQGVVNGDLEILDRKYAELDEDYEKQVKRLALLYNRR